MKKKMLKKSEVLREGYVQGLKEAKRIINEFLMQSSWGDEDEPQEMGTLSGRQGAKLASADYARKQDLSKELYQCTSDNDIEEAIELLNQGADPNNAEYIMKVIDKKSLLLLSYLHKFGLDLNTLFCPDGFNNVSILSYPIAMFYWDENGEFYFNEAAATLEDKKIAQIVKKLIEYGADPNIVDNNAEEPFVPLFWAIEAQAVEVVKTLLANGAKVRGVKIDGKTIMQRAKFRHDNYYESWQKEKANEIVRLLTKYQRAK